MKKTLIATAALLSLQATAVSAANVNIYGVIEEGILVQKADGANATTELKSAFEQKLKAHPIGGGGKG